MRQKVNSLQITAIVLCCALGVFLISICVKYIMRRVSPSDAAPAASDGGLYYAAIDWAKQYPYDEADEATAAVQKPVLTEAFMRCKAAVSTFQKKVETYATDDILFHNEMTEAGNAYEKLLGWDVSAPDEYNTIITFPDGYLTTVFPRADTEEMAADITWFSDSCKRRDLPFLYVQGPCKTNVRDTEVEGVVDFTNETADSLLDRLQSGGVETLDLRQAMESAGRWEHASFYRTDHHWLPQTGLWAAGVIAERLNADYGFDVDTALFDESRYTYEVLPNWFLGSQGKKATLAVTTPEDFVFLHPMDDMRYTFSIPNASVELTGTFDIFYWRLPAETCDYYAGNPYEAYFYSDQDYKSVHNLSVENGKRLLMISDSYGNSMTPFLCQGIEYVDVIDLRYFNGSLQRWLGTHDYDAVVVAYSAFLLNFDGAGSANHTGWHFFR